MNERKKKICFLFGAGAEGSENFDLPTGIDFLREISNQIFEKIKSDAKIKTPHCEVYSQEENRMKIIKMKQIQLKKILPVVFALVSLAGIYSGEYEDLLDKYYVELHKEEIEAEKLRLAKEKEVEERHRVEEAKAAEARTKTEIEKITMRKIRGKSYEMMTTEVTQGLYKAVMGENPSYFRKDNKELNEDKKSKLPENTDSYPVEQVSWYDAIYFCNELSQKCGLAPVYFVNGSSDVTKWDYVPHKGGEITGKIGKNARANGYRLSTEAEWEYAARGGQNYKYAGSDNVDEVGWHIGCSEGMTHPVAQKKPNSYGLYDMSGNVLEWCCDIYNGTRKRCVRGGFWNSVKSHYEVAYRDGDYADNRYNNCGFRLARNVD